MERLRGTAVRGYRSAPPPVRRSLIVRTSETVVVLKSTRILNDAERLASVLARCGEAPPT